MENCMKRFLQDETGAVTVDWVVLTAGVVVLGMMIVPALLQPVSNMAVFIGEMVTSAHAFFE